MVCSIFITINISKSYAGELPDRGDAISSATANAVATHTIGFQYANITTPVAAIEIQFCQESPLIGDPCTAPPANFDISGPSFSLANQTGNTGFTVFSHTGGKIILHCTAVGAQCLNPPILGQRSTYEFTNVTNPGVAGTYYLRFQTFGTFDTSLPDIDYGGDAIAILPATGYNVSSVVPPYLLFCAAVTISNLNCNNATGDQINFGDFDVSNTSAATSQLVTATNSPSGFTTSIYGFTMTSGNNAINSLQTPTSSLTGQSQFGVNLEDNNQPHVGSGVAGSGTGAPTANYAITNRYSFNSGNNLISSSQPSGYQKFTVSYIVNISPTSALGVYATTMTYICLANF